LVRFGFDETVIARVLSPLNAISHHLPMPQPLTQSAWPLGFNSPLFGPAWYWPPVAPFPGRALVEFSLNNAAV
jgi:hypothetical protein